VANENKEILYVVESLSNAKGVGKEVIFEAIESALSSVTARRFDGDVSIRVEIDQSNGAYETFRRWEIIADQLPDDFELNTEQHLTLAQAKEIYGDGDFDVGEWVEEKIESEQFGRISAQQAKQVIIQKVREAERVKIKSIYAERIGEMVIGIVKKVTREFLVIDLGENAEALLKRDQLVPRESFRMNDRVRIMLQSIREESRGPQVEASRICPEFLIELFKIEVPEIGEEVIEIKAAARDPGMRAKIAVKTNDGRVDPVGACVGMRGSRVQAVSNELNGERVDIVLWDDNPAQLVLNAMKPAEIESVVVDEDNKAMDIAVADDQLSLAIGRAGQNVRLASELTGWKLNVMSVSDAANKHEVEAERIIKHFVEQLDVDQDIAKLLVLEGYISVESLAFADVNDLQKVNGLDSEIAAELLNRANDILLIAELSGQENVDPSADLLDLDGMTTTMAETLAKNSIVTRDDLAELSIGELNELIDLDDEAAGQLIMKAREHWFTDK
jgi:transcription termination/antitermination protein NusA